VRGPSFRDAHVLGHLLDLRDCVHRRVRPGDARGESLLLRACAARRLYERIPIRPVAVLFHKRTGRLDQRLNLRVILDLAGATHLSGSDLQRGLRHVKLVAV
jgi:hypothetical protein